MATSKKSPSRTAAKSKSTRLTKPVVSASVVADGSRRLKAPRRKFYKRQAKRFKARPKLPNVITLTKLAARLLFANWKLVGGIMLIYGLLNILLVRGLNGGANVGELKSQVDGLFSGASGHLASGLTVFGLLLTSSNNVASAAASAYQTFLFVIVSLALVWSYRQLLAGTPIKIRDGFYRGMSPLVPVLLVLLVVALEVIPLVVGGWLYALLTQQGIAITGLEQLISLIIFLLLASLSCYLLCSTVFALYIATLPDMTPLRAMRSARELVRYRRWPIIRKLLFLPLVLLLVGACVMLPFILFAAVLAQWIFFVLTTITLAAVHAYMYTLYRALLHE